MFARGLQLGAHDAVVRLERLHLVLQLLERLPHVGLALLHTVLDFLPHLLLRGLHVVRGLLLPLVRAREEFLRLRPRILLAREFERGLLLRLFERLDAAVQILDETLGSRARTGWLAAIFKCGDLRLQTVNLLLLRFEFLVRAACEIRADGDGRASLGDPVHRLLQIPAQLLALRDRALVRLGERLALALEIHDLPLVVAAEHRHAALHVGGQFVELQIQLGRSRLCGRCGCWGWRGGVLREPQRNRRADGAIRRRK